MPNMNASYYFPLRGGVGIGVRGNDCAGTLGGFLEDEDGNCYILSADHVLNPEWKDTIKEPVHFAGTSEQSSTDVKGVDNNRLNQESTAKEIIIEQPARSDYDSMFDSALQELRFFKKQKKGILEINRQKEERNVKGLDQFMKSIDRDIAEAEARLEDVREHKPREVGKYLFGLRQNVHMDDQNCWHFVDAGIAELNEYERSLMMLLKNQEDPMNRCPLYGFENNGDFRPNGKIVSSENFGKLLREERKFSKIGRETGFTREGFFRERKSELFRNFLFRSTPEFLRPSLYPVGNPSEESCQLLTCKDKDDVDSGVSLPWGQNCFVIDAIRKPFCEPGDVGAIVFDDEGLAWGMIVGQFEVMDMDFCIVAPLWVALKALEQKYGIKGLKLWCVNELENRLLDDKEYRARFVEKHRKMAKQLRDNEILMAQLQTKIVEQQTKLRNRTNKNEILTNNSVGDRLHYLKNRAITSDNLVNEDEGTHGSLKKRKKYNQERPAELAGFRNCYNCPVSCVSSVVSFIFFSMGLPVCFKKFERGMQNSFNTLSRVCEEEFEVGDCSLAFKDSHDVSIIEKEHKISLVITDAGKADHHLERAIEIMKDEQHPALFIMHYKSDTGRVGHCLAIMPDSKFTDVQQECYWNP